MGTIKGNNNIQASGSITINDKTYQGNTVTVTNGVVYVDGEKVSEDDGGETANILRVEITGNVGSVTSDKSVTVHGNVEGNVDARGSVNCDDVGGDVESGGSVNCDDVKGGVTAGGSVNADRIGGSVVAGGSVRT